MPTITKIPGIVLAAGLSTRMGEPKQLLRFGNSTVIETVIDNMLESKLSEVIVVLGHEVDKVRERIRHKPVKIVFNVDYQDGMLTSAQCGARALSGSPAAFALMLVDQPLITPDLINLVVEAYKEVDKGIVLPSYNYRRGHPAIFARRYITDILALDVDDGGIRSLFKTYPDDIHYVSINTNRVLKDIDYRRDYEGALMEEKERKGECCRTFGEKAKLPCT